MKIVELITPRVVQTTTKKPHDIEAGTKSSKKNGSAYGLGKPIDKGGIQGAEYSKTNYFPSELQDDAYYAYIEAVKPLMGGNPYVPEIYRIVHIKDPSGQVIPRYEMRTYKSRNNFNRRELLSILSKISDQETQEAENDGDDGDSIWYRIIGVIQDATRRDLVTKDQELNQVLEIIRDVVSSNPAFKYDMHGGNFMVRRTPYGPQLVITDPVQDGGASTTKSSGISPWLAPRDDLDFTEAVRSLARRLEGMVDDLSAAGIKDKPTQEQVDQIIRRIGIQNSVSREQLTAGFVKWYKKTPLEYSIEHMS